MLEIRNICKSYQKRPFLDHISLKLEPGTLYALAGPHASGKTTLLRILAGLISPDSGEILHNGRRIPPASRKLSLLTGYLPEYYSFYKHLTVYEYLEYFCAFYHIEGLKARCRCIELLEALDLTEWKDTPAEFLPVSAQQSLQLARTLIHNPPIVLIDNIRQNMDGHTQLIIREFLTRLTQEGKIIILASRFFHDIPSFAHNIGYLQNGQLQMSGSMEKLLSQMKASAPLRIRVCAQADHAYRLLYEHPFVRTLSREKNTFSVELIVDYRAASIPKDGVPVAAIDLSIEVAESKLLSDLLEANIPVSAFYREQPGSEQLLAYLSEVSNV